MKNWKFRTKLLLSYVIVVSLPVLFINSFLMARIRDTVIDQTGYINQIGFNQLKDNLSHLLSNYLGLSSNIQMEPRFTDYLTTNYNSSKQEDIMLIYSEYLTFQEACLIKFGSEASNVKVTFYSSNDTLLFDEKNICFLSNDVKSQDWYLETLRRWAGKSISLRYDESNKKYYVLFGNQLMILKPSNQYLNFYVLEIAESEIYKLIEKEGENKSIYLIDNNNKVISTTDRENIGLNISDIELFNEINLTDHVDASLTINNGSLFAYVSSINDSSMIDGWKIVMFVSFMDIMKEINNISEYGIVMSIIILLAVMVLVIIISGTITKPLRQLTHNMSKIRDGFFEVTDSYESEDEIGELSEGFRQMLSRINTLIEEVYKADMRVKDLTIKNKDAEIKALLSQIKPHFLFNTMESIRMNLLKKNDLETAGIIQDYAKLLRTSIDWADNIIPLKQEISLVESLMKIQKYRFREQFNYDISLSEEEMGYLIPKFSLQPIVENASHHGLEMKGNMGTIKIYARITEEDFRIIVEDDGVGMSSSRLESVRHRLNSGGGQYDGEETGIGMINVHNRIKLYYGEGYGVEIDSEEGVGTMVVLVLPHKEQGDLIV